MKITIRRGVFETNSSSTHSLTICTNESYEKWIKGDAVLNEGWSRFLGDYPDIIPIEDVPAVVLKYKKETQSKYADFSEDITVDDIKYDANYEDLLRDIGLYTYQMWLYDDCLDTYETNFTTPSGDKMIAFGKYGYAG